MTLAPLGGVLHHSCAAKPPSSRVHRHLHYGRVHLASRWEPCVAETERLHSRTSQIPPKRTFSPENSVQLAGLEASVSTLGSDSGFVHQAIELPNDEIIFFLAVIAKATRHLFAFFMICFRCNILLHLKCSKNICQKLLSRFQAFLFPISPFFLPF